MANHPQLLLQKKVFDLLSGDATLIALLAEGVASVRDTGAKDNVQFPYITIGESDLADWSSHTHTGFKGYFMVHTWGTKPGRKEVQTIMNRVYALLHGTNLQLTGFPTIGCWCESNTVLVDTDMRGHHGVQRFEIQLGGN